MTNVEIYALRDPRDGSLRYIGKANCAKKRLASHLRDARRRDTPVYRWMRKLGTLGMRPTLEILDRPAADAWEACERHHIAEARERGERLLNVAEGGDEPYCSPEVRSRNGQRLVARIREDAKFREIWHYKRMLSQALRDGLLSNRARAMMREAAQLRPDLFGRWAGLPDREETENGEPVGGYGKLKGGRIGAPVQAQR